VLSLAFDSSGSTLASGGGDNSIRLWDAKTQRQKGNPFLGHKHPVFAVAFSEAARELISLDRSGEIRFWDTNSGRSTVAIGGETVACVVAGSFNANRRWLAYARQCMSDWSLGTGASIRIWDLRSREFLEFESGGLVLPAPAWGELSINADGTKVALASGHAVLVWDVLPTLWETKACQIANRNLSVAEWEKYVNSGAKYPYRCTCPDLPSGEGASAKCRQ
jgi:WD40 repeat protein